MKRENYFDAVRIIILILFSAYGILKINSEEGVSFVMLLLVAFAIGLFSIGELVSNKKKWIFTLAALGVGIVLSVMYGRGFILTIVFFIYEILAILKVDWKWYMLPIVLPVIWPGDVFLMMIMILFIAMVYIQHEKIIVYYQEQLMQDTKQEQKLKRNMQERDREVENELKKNALITENQILEERSQLSQTLHDKLGHNINGSIYQLEAIKLLIEADPERAKGMTQGVIDQLRGGMDEIRGILRKKRPDRNQMALLQIYKLCEDCNSKGVETSFEKEGDLTVISDRQWEIILDNAFEAVSNSMKYAKCSHIDIRLFVMNKLIRCSISDDGVGCKEIKDGMGISGMRRRIRAAGGTLSFETHDGFKINMIMPCDNVENG
ncbi:MAG: hypothetical protein IJJ74_04990 [Eubacterium sp.]|nr:hypothetical protein [Eubacterium sp.]